MDARPDNTSAIIALQRAAATPSEMTKQNLYDATEELSRIYFEFIGEYYGKRYVMLPPPPEQVAQAQAIGLVLPDKMPMLFDFSLLKQHPMLLKLDVGASTYYSEIAAMQTMDGLLRLNAISVVQYLERVSDDYIPNRRALIDEIKEEIAKQEAMQAMMAGMPTPPDSGLPPSPAPSSIQAMDEQPTKPDIPTGGGYSALQRKINETGMTPGMI